MDFDSPSQVISECTNMLISQSDNMINRTRINRLFNGEAPNSDDERRAQNLKTNVNFLEATRIASNATNQVNNAFFKGDRFFTVNLDKGPVFKRAQYSASITKAINRELKRSRAYRSARESAHAQVVLHGPGPLIWQNRRTPIPTEVGVEDVVVPSGTFTSMKNLDRFGVYRELTWDELGKMTSGPATDKGWNMPYVKALLVNLFADGIEPIYQGNRWMFPEKVYEDIKEGAAWSASSSLPKVMVWEFFMRDEKTDKWTRKVCLDYGTVDTSKVKEHADIRKNQEFLYERADYADDWEQIIHWYIGNCSNVAPYRYYSIRSIGYLLYGVCMISNKTRNRLQDHIFQALLTLFRNVSDDNREKVGMIDLQNFGVMPDGLSMVPANERHVVDWNLIQMSLAQGRQLMAESAQAFVPDLMMDTSREMTATETLVRQNTSVSLTSAVMNQLAEQSKTEYREICRRFCIKGNSDPMVKRFRAALEKEEVPMDMLDCEAWEIMVEQTVGGGNKAVELTVTQALMQEIFPLADPTGQRLMARRRYLALTDNPEEAMLVFPDAPKPPSDDVQYAQIAFVVLMEGQPFAMKEGVNHVAYAAMLMQQMQIALQQVAAAMQQPQGLAIAAIKVVGLFNVASHVQEQINIVARVENQLDKAKMMMKALVEMTTMLTNLAKQLMAEGEAQTQQGGISPETQQKLQEKMLLAQTTAQITEANAAQKREQKQISWSEENERRNATTAADIQRKQVLTQTEAQAKIALTQTDIAAKDLETQAEILRPRPATTSK